MDTDQTKLYEQAFANWDPEEAKAMCAALESQFAEAFSPISSVMPTLGGLKTGLLSTMVSHAKFSPITEIPGGTMTIDTTIDQYRQTKDKMASIIDRHMSEAFAEIKQEFGTTPAYVSLDVVSHQTFGEKYPNGVYAGCSVTLGGE